MSALPQTGPVAVTASTSWVDAQILALATKLDPANATQLAALMAATLRYGVTKLSQIAALKPYAPEIQAVEAVI
jgi:hypothetical protein